MNTVTTLVFQYNLFIISIQTTLQATPVSVAETPLQAILRKYSSDIMEVAGTSLVHKLNDTLEKIPVV